MVMPLTLMFRFQPEKEKKEKMAQSAIQF